MKKLFSLLLCAGAALTASAACPSRPTTERFVINGAEVTDQRTGLTWARCSVGQSWSGSACTGTATTMTHEAAMAHAQGQSGWRMPNVKELASLADIGCANPAIDSVAFPNTPFSGWSSSPYAGSSNVAWFVGFGDGGVGYFGGRGSNVAVRLVRVSQ